MPAYFTREFTKFLRELSKNNNRPWFNANKERYIKHVKEPFTAFVEDLIASARTLDKEVDITSKEAMFRIYRDVRFSKDKSPYKPHASAVISSGGRKKTSIPGMYIRLSHEGVWYYGGVHMPSAENRDKVRRAILRDPKKFKKLITAKSFVKYFGGLEVGERNIRLQPEFEEIREDIPEIANKSFMYVAKLPAKLITDPKLKQVLMQHWKAAEPVKNFLGNAVKGK